MRVTDTNGNVKVVWSTNINNIPLGVPSGRLTLTSGKPVTTSDVTGAGTIYYTPYVGNRICLYSGGWQSVSFSETSLSLTATSGDNYDVFAYLNGGVLALELSAAWNSNTARFASGTYASNLPTQDGIWIKSTDGTNMDATRRYLGTIRADGTNTVADAARERFVWNAYNAVPRKLQRGAQSNSWTYATASWREASGSTNSHYVQVVIGNVGTMVNVNVSAEMVASVATAAYSVGVGINASNANSADTWCEAISNAATIGVASVASLNHYPAIGYNAYYWVEYERAGTGEVFGVPAGGAQTLSGIVGSMLA